MKLKITVLICAVVLVTNSPLFGCARVRMEAPKDPIKVDITMRVDVYQHVQEDIDAIEGIVSGESPAPTGQDLRGSNLFFLTDAYAQEDLSPELTEAALRRKERLSLLHMLESEGIVGENKSGLVEVRAATMITPDAQVLVEEENRDRMVIYEGIAEKNGTAVSEVQKVYAVRLQGDAPAGTPIETDKGWMKK